VSALNHGATTIARLDADYFGTTMTQNLPPRAWICPVHSEVPSDAAGSALPFAPAERYRQRMRHRFGALPVRTSALVALSVLGLLLAGRLISGPSTVRARPPATTLAYRAPSRYRMLH
jgi:hypothetical protein